MLARLGPASFLSCGRDTAARFIRSTPYSHWHSAQILVHYYRFHISPQPPVGLRVRGRKLEGRTSQYQAFACAIAWLLVPALLNLAYPHQPVAIASISQCSHCFHPTPRGGLKLDLVGLGLWMQTKNFLNQSDDVKNVFDDVICHEFWL